MFASEIDDRPHFSLKRPQPVNGSVIFFRAQQQGINPSRRAALNSSIHSAENEVLKKLPSAFKARRKWRKGATAKEAVHNLHDTPDLVGRAAILFAKRLMQEWAYMRAHGWVLL